MSIRWLLTVNAIVGLAGGLGLAASPSIVAGLLGLALDDVASLYARLYGAELIGFNVATWLARDAGREGRRLVILGHVGNESLTFVVVAASIGAVGANALAWGVAGLALVFAAAFALAASGRVFHDRDGSM